MMHDTQQHIGGERRQPASERTHANTFNSSVKEDRRRRKKKEEEETFRKYPSTS